MVRLLDILGTFAFLRHEETESRKIRLKPEVQFGSGIVAMLMPFLCSPKIAKELLLTGDDHVTPEQALQWGLLNRVVKERKLEQAARELALRVARNDQLAVRITKQAINTCYEIGAMRDALRHALELDLAIETTETEESREFNEILHNEGVKAALAWRDRRMGITGRVKRHDIA